MSPAAATATRARPSRLGAIKRERLRTAHRFVFYGPEGVGKSTLASHAPAPLWFDVEDGSAHLEVARYPFGDGPAGHVPQSFQAVLDAIDDLATAEHDFQTLVLDSADRLEGLIYQHMLAQHSGKQTNLNKSGRPMKSIEDFGYGKGFNLEVEEWRVLCDRLDRLRRERDMNVIVLGHATVKTFKNPEGDDFDRYSLRVHEKSAAFIREWSDVFGFVTYEQFVDRGPDGNARPRGAATGRRVVKLERTAAYDAKTRLHLPDELVLGDDPWDHISRAITFSQDLTPDSVVSAIGVELQRIGDQELIAKVDAAVTAAGTDTSRLWRYLKVLQKRPSKEETP